MALPICYLNGQSSTGGLSVSPSSLVTIQLQSLAGVNSWSIACTSTDETSNASTINSSLTINQVTRTATFTAPSAGRALVFTSIVNSGLRNGVQDPTLTSTFGVYVPTTAGLRVLAVNERTEGNSYFGWVAPVNVWLRGI